MPSISGNCFAVEFVKLIRQLLRCRVRQRVLNSYVYPARCFFVPLCVSFGFVCNNLNRGSSRRTSACGRSGDCDGVARKGALGSQREGRKGDRGFRLGRLEWMGWGQRGRACRPGGGASSQPAGGCGWRPQHKQQGRRGVRSPWRHGSTWVGRRGRRWM